VHVHLMAGYSVNSITSFGSLAVGIYYFPTLWLIQQVWTTTQPVCTLSGHTLTDTTTLNGVFLNETYLLNISNLLVTSC